MANRPPAGQERPADGPPGPSRAASSPSDPGSTPGDAELFGGELLIEEISIDGMCGVY